MVGGQDELIFDGSSLAFNKDGLIIAAGRPFIEETIFVDYSKNSNKFSIKKHSEEEQLYNALCLGVKDYFLKTGHEDALIGLSGGIDSALVSCIAVDALGSSKVHTISLPSKYSSGHSIQDAQLLGENLNTDHKTIKINELVNVMDNTLDFLFKNTKSGVAEENIQARVRGNILMALSNKFNWLLLSTGNKTEMALGYCTLYGDMCGGLSVISDVNKLRVYKLANWINKVYPNRIPKNIILKPPSAELAPNQVDPFDYNLVSPIVDAFIENRSSVEDIISTNGDKNLSNLIYNRIKIMEYKRRQSAIGFRVTKKAFGLGRRIPIVNHFEG
jgi:NAD+ synthase (glutamine-hydrolysing)